MSFNNNNSIKSNRSVSVTRAVSSFSSPSYRGAINHGASAELQEGYRILTNGQKVTVIDSKQLLQCLTSTGMGVGEEELLDLLRVVHQSDRPNQQDDFEFADFLHLMTQEVSDDMLGELKSTFHAYDKNKTGYISKKTFTEMFVTMGEHSNAEELEELLCLAEASASPDDSEKIDYNKFITDMGIRLNSM